MQPLTFRFDRTRVLRIFVALIALLSFPVVLALLGHGDTTLYTVFGIICIAYVGTVAYTAARFKLELDDSELRCRGRTRSRTIALADVQQFVVRTGRDKASRFMGPAPFRELVLHTQARPVVISSLPLGEAAFDELVSGLSKRLPEPGQNH